MARLVVLTTLYCLFSLLVLSLYTDFPTFVDSIAPAPAPAPPPFNQSPPPPPPVTVAPLPPPVKPATNPPPPPPKPVDTKKGSGGLNGGQKAGIVIGVMLGTGLMVFGALVYKKRRSNIRRRRFGYAARDTFL